MLLYNVLLFGYEQSAPKRTARKPCIFEYG